MISISKILSEKMLLSKGIASFEFFVLIRNSSRVIVVLGERKATFLLFLLLSSFDGWFDVRRLVYLLKLLRLKAEYWFFKGVGSIKVI